MFLVSSVESSSECYIFQFYYLHHGEVGWMFSNHLYVYVCLFVCLQDISKPTNSFSYFMWSEFEEREVLAIYALHPWKTEKDRKIVPSRQRSL